MLDIFYLAVAALAVYVGLLYLRRAGPAQRTYAWLLLGDGALAGVAYGLGKVGEAATFASLAGALSLFGFALLVFPVPGALRLMTRWALRHGRERLASALATARETLTPGLGARQERDLIDAARAVRAGQADAVLAALRTRHAATADRRERQAIEDRMVLILLSARRWREAVDVFEARSEDVIRPAQILLFVDMLQAYGELGELRDAARVLLFLERLPAAGEPALAPHVARARLFFLAYAGRADAVERVAREGAPPLFLSAAARAYFVGLARLHAGDAVGARAALGEAVRLSADARLRAEAQERLTTVRPAAEPRALTPELAAVADDIVERAAAAAVDAPPILEGLPAAATPVTLALIAANLAVFAIVYAVFGTTTESWALARAGANFDVAVNAGEWWRLVACTFLHVGVVHVAVNMVSLWQLGRVVEPAAGSLRTGAIYAVAGIGGSLASYFFGKGGLSAGASGAVFGLVGAAIVEIWLHRRGRANRWRSALLNNLFFLVIVQLGIGYATPIIDQSAHVGGLVAGALATLVLSRRHAFGRTRAGHALAVVVAAVGLAATAAAAYGVVTSPYARTVERIGWRKATLAGVELEVPRSWVKNDDALVEPLWGLRSTVAAAQRPAIDYGGIFDEFTAELGQRKDVEGLQSVPPSLAAPRGWRAYELRFTAVDEERVVVRLPLFVRLAGHLTVIVPFFVPEAALDEARPVLERIIASVHIAP